MTRPRKRAAAFLTLAMLGSPGKAETELPPTDAFMMERSREIALAKSAAPHEVSEHATVMVLTRDGYETVAEGTNGFVCLVLRSWGNPTFDPAAAYDPGIVVPECLDANAVDVILPMQLFRAELGLEHTPAEKIGEAVREGFRSGRFRRTRTVSFSYMLSTEMTYAPGKRLAPHVMVYLPDSYTNDSVGGLGYGRNIMIVEGGPDEAFTAANIYREGIAPRP